MNWLKNFRVLEFSRIRRLPRRERPSAWPYLKLWVVGAFLWCRTWNVLRILWRTKEIRSFLRTTKKIGWLWKSIGVVFENQEHMATPSRGAHERASQFSCGEVAKGYLRDFEDIGYQVKWRLALQLTGIPAFLMTLCFTDRILRKWKY